MIVGELDKLPVSTSYLVGRAKDGISCGEFILLMPLLSSKEMMGRGPRLGTDTCGFSGGFQWLMGPENWCRRSL
jgi:hypothetical protein